MRAKSWSRLAVLGAALSSAWGAAAEPLSAYSWSHRPVLVFAPSVADARLVDQLAQFNGRGAGLAEREMPVVVIVDDAVTIDGAASALNAGEIRTAYAVAGGAFEVLLIGKDTGVKLRAAAPVTPERLFDLVDAMPMRQREMREGAPAGE